MKCIDYKEEAVKSREQSWDPDNNSWWCSPLYGTRFFENGEFRITHSGDRDPDFRKSLFDRMGILLGKPNELGGELIDPGADQRIAFSWLNPKEWFIYEPDFNRVFTVGRPLIYPDVTTCPVGQPIRVRKPNRKKRKQWLAAFDDKMGQFRAMYEMAHGVSDVYNGSTRMNYYISAEQYETGVGLLTGNLSYIEANHAMYVRSFLNNDHKWKKRVEFEACDQWDAAYLCVSK